MLKQRRLFGKILKHLSDKRHTVITGARQVGKTSLLKLIYKQLKEVGKEVYYLSFEDIRILESINVHPNKLFDFIPSVPVPILNGREADRTYVLIDEVQYAADPTHFLKYLYDHYEANLKLVVTGSSAFYIDRKFRDSLAGRKRIFHLFPLSFDELLDFKEAKNLSEEITYLRERENYVSPYVEELKKYFFEYLTYGGYPAVVLEANVEEKRFLLEELKNAYVKRDMLESNVVQEGKFYLLMQILADQIGNLVNKNNLAGTLHIDNKTIDNYLYILAKCHHIHLVKPYFRNLKKELTRMPKIYFNDLGLRNAFLNRFESVPNRTDKGQLLENYYFLLFRKTFAEDQVKFWRTADKQEIDFVIEESFEKGKAYEIKWNPSAFRPGKYKKFTETYPGFELSCLGADSFYLKHI